jgi:NTE family protein
MINKILSALLLFISLYTNAQYKNLVFEGGGIRGVAYAGAVKTLEEKNILQHIEKVAGTSAGSIIALMIGLGYNATEIGSMMTNLHIEHFNDGRGGLIGKYRRVKKFYGIYRGAAFEKWLEATFADLHAALLQKAAIGLDLKDFYCVGTNLTKQQAEIFSFQTTPNLSLKTAVRISCSIPLFYEPVLLDSAGKEISKPVKGQYYQLYADGGIMANYPVNIFDSCLKGRNPLFCDSVIHNYQTLGIKLDRNEQIAGLALSTDIPAYDIKNLKDYVGAFVNLMMETLNRKPNLENEKGRTIYIGYGNVFSKPRKMKSSEKKALFESGRMAVENYFKK